MILYSPSPQEFANCKQEFGYYLISISRNGIWSIGIMPVLFGVRAVAWRQGSAGCSVEYCCGNNEDLLTETLASIQTIFHSFSEDISEREVEEFFPKWNARPINRDNCFNQLCELARRLAGAVVRDPRSASSGSPCEAGPPAD